MPQLDYLIIFPQIFWFFIIFGLFYYILTYIFLPYFLTSLKIRKAILNQNEKALRKLTLRFGESNISLKNKLLNDLSFIQNKVYENSPVKLKVDSTKFDEQFANTMFTTLIFCDRNVLQNISLHSKIFNLKFKKKLFNN